MVPSTIWQQGKSLRMALNLQCASGNHRRCKTSPVAIQLPKTSRIIRIEVGMMTEEQIEAVLEKQLKHHIDQGRRRFILGPYLGQPCAVRVRSTDEEINQWIKQHPRKLRPVDEFPDFNVYILDEKLYTMFLLRWA